MVPGKCASHLGVRLASHLDSLVLGEFEIVPRVGSPLPMPWTSGANVEKAGRFKVFAAAVPIEVCVHLL